MQAFAVDAELQMPESKRCLSGGGLAALMGDEGASVLDGLSVSQVTVAMNSFLPELRRCASSEGPVRAKIEAEIEVSCDGTVARVGFPEAENHDEALLSCLGETLSHAAFDAHDMHDGYVFGYALRLDLPRRRLPREEIPIAKGVSLRDTAPQSGTRSAI